jgi:hypothetical protein
MQSKQLQQTVNERRAARGVKTKLSNQALKSCRDNGNWQKKTMTDVLDIFDHEIEIVKKKK